MYRYPNKMDNMPLWMFSILWNMSPKRKDESEKAAKRRKVDKEIHSEVKETLQNLENGHATPSLKIKLDSGTCDILFLPNVTTLQHLFNRIKLMFPGKKSRWLWVKIVQSRWMIDDCQNITLNKALKSLSLLEMRPNPKQRRTSQRRTSQGLKFLLSCMMPM